MRAGVNRDRASLSRTLKGKRAETTVPPSVRHPCGFKGFIPARRECHSAGSICETKCFN